MARLGLGYDDAARDQSATDLLLDLAAMARAARASARPATTSITSAIPGCSICSRGRSTRPVVPPMLVADIAGGSFPAVINILLALARARPKRAGLSPRHRHDRRDVHIRLVGAGDRRRNREISQAGRTVAGRRLAALSALSGQGRQARRLRRASSRNSGERSPRRSACRRNSSTTGAIRRRRATRWPN